MMFVFGGKQQCDTLNTGSRPNGRGTIDSAYSINSMWTLQCTRAFYCRYNNWPIQFQNTPIKSIALGSFQREFYSIIHSTIARGPRSWTESAWHPDLVACWTVHRDASHNFCIERFKRLSILNHKKKAWQTQFSCYLSMPRMFHDKKTQFRVCHPGDSIYSGASRTKGSCPDGCFQTKASEQRVGPRNVERWFHSAGERLFLGQTPHSHTLVLLFGHIHTKRNNSVLQEGNKPHTQTRQKKIQLKEEKYQKTVFFK